LSVHKLNTNVADTGTRRVNNSMTTPASRRRDCSH
jgi:hypothetical protein